MTIDMSMTRTDLALESVQAAAKAAREDAVPGVRSQENRREGYAITHIRIDSDVGAQALGKPVGRYVTVDLGPYFRREEDYFDRGVRCLAQELRGMLPEGPVLAAGLGNRAMTCDAVGPAVVDNLLVTRHMIRAMPRQFADFRPVAAVCPGVLARTGMEALELVRGAVERVHPGAGPPAGLWHHLGSPAVADGGRRDCPAGVETIKGADQRSAPLMVSRMIVITS